MQKQQKIKGIVRNSPQSVVEDFSCTELVNMRYKGEAWRPTGEKDKIVSTNPICPTAGSNHEKLSLFIHSTGDTKQMVGVINGVVKYFNFPKGNVAIDIFPLPADEIGRKVRFNAVGNILVIFLEEYNGKPPYMKYAYWKATENNSIKSYHVLDPLGPPKLSFGISEQEILGESGLTIGVAGTGLLTYAYQTIYGDYIKQGPIICMDYKPNQNNECLLLLSQKNSSYNNLVPETWRDIILNVSIFSTVPNRANSLSDEAFDVYIKDIDTKFYKIYEINKDTTVISKPSGKADVVVEYMNIRDYNHSDDGLEFSWFSVPLSCEVREFTHPSELVFGKQRPEVSTSGDPQFSGAPTSCFFKKKSNAQIQLSLDLSFSYSATSSSNENTTIRVFLTRKDGSTGNNMTPIHTIYEGDMFKGTQERDVHYNGTINLTTQGEYYLIVWLYCNTWKDSRMETTNIGSCSASYTTINGYSGDILRVLPIQNKEVLVTRPILDMSVNNDTYGARDFSYNSRLFLGDTTSILFEGYSMDDYVPISTNIFNMVVYCVVYIKTDDGIKTVVSSGHMFVIAQISNELYYIFAPTMFCYPDYNAYKMEIYVKNTNNNGFCRAQVYSLKSCYSGGFSYCRMFSFSYKLKDGEGNPLTRTYNTTVYDPYGMRQLFSPTWNILELPQSNNTIHSPNNTAVASLHLPMIYPNTQQNLVGEKGVVGFSVNNMAIDANNFGLYPLFVFTGNGIYAMELGRTGETLIQRIVPLNGDVCINGDSITNIGGATLFATKDGLRVLQGQQSVKITEPLENYTENPLSIEWGGQFEKILTHYGLKYCISEVGFQEYLKKAKCFLNYKENEVVITNTDYLYSYVYELNTKQYHKVYESYYNVLNDYPNAYGTNSYGNEIYDLGSEQFPYNVKKNILVQTNAFKLGTDEFEMIRRIIARISITNTPTERIGAYLFVSNDTRKWAIVDATEVTGVATNFNYLSCPASVKYGILVIAGQIDMVKDCLTHLSVEYEKRYENKIR